MNTRLLITLTSLLLPLTSDGALPQHDQYEHLGVRSCGASSCHGSAGVRNTYSVLQNEYITWARHDLHSKAYDVLRNERSERIAENLGLDAAHTAKICLDCHSDYVPRERRGLQFQLADGVACEACHGGAEKWLGVHITGGGDKHEESLAAGLYPTEDPVARAELCLSCHLGTKDKFATHEIMGAGHPRLSFDLQKFTDLQPRHYRVDADYRERKKHVEDTRAWAIGQVAASRQYMTLLQGSRMAGSGLFPELGLFDCHGCHRSLKDQRWMPDASSPTPPGSVMLNDSSLAMSQAVAKAVAPAMTNSLNGAIRDLHAASQTDVASIRAAAGRLDGLLAQLGSRLDGMNFGAQSNAAIMSELRSAAASYSDYSDAEQVTMALDVFSGITRTMKGEVDSLYEVMADEDHFDPAVFAAVFTGASTAGVARTTPATPVSQPTAPPVATTQPLPRAPVMSERPAVSSRPAAVTSGDLGPHVVMADSLRIRAVPTVEGRVVGSLYQGNPVAVTERRGDWARIQWQDYGRTNEGWVAGRFLAAE
ncbi:MAG: SH3 domain-containing protein [Gammaproteobacteria bacterium]|nr:SH3 domain-containing protein [Gammaproteobacteria bacterium]